MKKKKKSLLTRLFGGKKKKANPAAKRGTPTPKGRPAQDKPRPLTPLDRSIKEIKHLADIGQKDPERLAMILGKMFKEQREKKRQDQERLDQLIRDILAREEGGAPPASP